MKKFILMVAMALGSAGAWAQSVGDKIAYGEDNYTVIGENLFANGSFEDGVTGWKTVDYTTDAVASNFKLTATGGFDDGAYITTNGAGVGSANTIRQSVAVESGKTYYFRVYTSGKAPASNNFNYNALFKMTDFKTENGVLKAFAWPQGAEQTTSDWNLTEYVFTATTPYVGVRMGWNASSSFDGFYIAEVEREFDVAAWNTAKANAEEIAGAYSFEDSDAEMTALFNAVMDAYSKENPTNVAELDAQVNALNEAVAALKTLGDNRLLEQTKAGLTSAIKRIKTEYPYTSEALFSTDISKWPGSTYVANNGNEHWSGVRTNYYEQTGAQWGQDSWSISASKTATLPAGKYAFVVTARASQGTTSIMTVDGEEFELSHVGAVGMGVATDGEATYNINKTYANGAGRGWEYHYAEFELDSPREVTISFAASANARQNWVSIANPVLYYDETAKASMDITNAKAELSDVMAAIKVPEANVGVPFGYKVAMCEGLNAELETAQDIIDNSTDLDEINAEIQQLTDAKAYLESEEAKVAPYNEGEKYSFVLAFDGWAYNNKAMTYIANSRNDHGNYNIQYNSEINLNYAQAFTMTQVEGGYKMSQIDAEGKERYICTGVTYGGNAAQIRTTLDAEKALVVKVIPTATDGKFNLWNTEANQYIGSQDAGVYTVNSHIDFNIVMAHPGKGDYINIWPENKYATICSPHAVHLMTDGIIVYTVDGVEENGTTLTMTELTLEDNTIPANTPVLLYAENGASNQHAGFGTAYAGMNLTKGLLTGVYADTDAPAGSYVMQNHDGAVGFYQVETEGDAQIWAYKCYLTAPAAGVKAFTLGGVATGIQTVESLTAGKAQIYDLNGRQLQKLQKGVNIVNGVKVLVK